MTNRGGRPRKPENERGVGKSISLDPAIWRALERYRQTHPHLRGLSTALANVLEQSVLGPVIEEERRHDTDTRGSTAPDRLVEA